MQIAHHTFEAGPHATDMLELLFDQMAMGIVVLDPNYHVLRFNSTWAGYVKRYAPHRAMSVQAGVGYFDLHPESRQRLDPVFASVLNGETARQQALSMTMEGRTSFWDMVATPLLEDKTVTGILLVCTDVTEQIEAQQRLENALRELKHSHEVIEQRVDERTRELQTLVTVQQALTSSLNLNEVLQVIAYEARRLTHTFVSWLELDGCGGHRL